MAGGCPRWNEVGFVRFGLSCVFDAVENLPISHRQGDSEENTGGGLTEAASGAEAETEGASGGAAEASVAGTAPGRWTPGQKRPSLVSLGGVHVPNCCVFGGFQGRPQTGAAWTSLLNLGVRSPANVCVALLADFHLVFVNVSHRSPCLLLFFYLFIIICAVLCGGRSPDNGIFLGIFGSGGGIKDLF